ncbi:MAG: hypothetical protein HN736_14535 [Anaerolineae bacterium]|jgi:hypothetical protein|nr:hypothetical protein [Anaerolineae bacterium]MBT3712994.1 hypothetical protein [Anaerolineae bacterium]MBT4309239.1 hypothetical protein [Anaerolineae bacterium]MBT4458530.1 hypothetical protein [Anaerolineae bacterium]MBT4842706.1 hypothetical protein [Anaerolineae bacterium]
MKPANKVWQMKAFPFFALMGWAFILSVFIIGLFVMAPTAAGYWGGNAKTIRDTAEVGSALLGQLGVLVTTPRWLEPLAFLGVASFMVGIALEFSTIPALLKNRGSLMSACFPYLKKEN